MYISIAQIIISVILIVLILLQERESGMSGLFGGGEEGHYHVRRGFERLVFGATIILVIALGALSLINIYIQNKL